MERESNPMQPMCRSGCGFYGNPATDGLCSVCYKDSLRKKQQPPVGSTPVSVPSPQPSPTFSPAITIPSAAQPTVHSLQQQHNEIKEIMATSDDHQRRVTISQETNTSTNTTENRQNSEENSSRHISNQVDGKLQEALISYPKKRGLAQKRLNSNQKKIAIQGRESLDTRQIPKQVQSRLEAGSSSSNRNKREGFRIKQITSTSTASSAPKRSFQRPPNQSLHLTKSIPKPPILNHNNIDASRAVNAAKILTTPQKGQAPADRISLKAKTKNYLNNTAKRKLEKVVNQLTVGKAHTGSHTNEIKNNTAIHVKEVELKNHKEQPPPTPPPKPKTFLTTGKRNIVKSGKGSQTALSTIPSTDQPTNLTTSRSILISHPFPKQKKSIFRNPFGGITRRNKLNISVATPVEGPQTLTQVLTTNSQTFYLLKKSPQDCTYTVIPSQSFLQPIRHVKLRSVVMPTKKTGSQSNGEEKDGKKSSSKKGLKDQVKRGSTSTSSSQKSSRSNDPEKKSNNSSSSSGKGSGPYDTEKSKEQETNGNNSNLSSQKSPTKDEPEEIDNNSPSSSGSRKRKINEENTAKTSSEAAASAGPSTSTQPAEDDKDKEDDKDAKKKKNRCSECRKKVGLTGFLCRCGGLYCAVHRYSDKHNCTFDYREHGAQEIRRNNPVVVGEKIQKI